MSLVNQLLRTDDVTVTLQWPQEAGAVYDVTVSPERLHTGGIVLTNAMTVMINLTVSYDIQYNVSIVSSVCGVTTNKALKIGKYTHCLLLIYTPARLHCMQLPVIYQHNCYITLFSSSLELRITLT